LIGESATEETNGGWPPRHDRRRSCGGAQRASAFSAYDDLEFVGSRGGAEAVSKRRVFAPDVVLMDLVPDVDGAEATVSYVPSAPTYRPALTSYKEEELVEGPQGGGDQLPAQERLG
jgi:hypothetical protein